MSGLFSDNTKAQCGKVVEKILRMYNIKDMQTEPHHPWQNPAERCIQVVKATTNVILDRTGARKVMWLLCMMYVVFLLNHLAHEKRTPIEAWCDTGRECTVVLPILRTGGLLSARRVLS
jgi:hypothetical protein